MAKILITGGAGYLGSKLSYHLLQLNHHVVVIDSLIYGFDPFDQHRQFKNFTFIQGCAADRKLLEMIAPTCDYIFPLAALVGASLCDRYPQQATKVNVEAVATLLATISEKQKIIYPTTNSGYGTKSNSIICDENTPIEPISHYGRTKVEAENMVLASGLATTLRLATVFGLSFRTRGDLLVNNFVKIAYQNRRLEIFEGHFMRNYVHIDDVIDCFIFAMENFELMREKTFNLGQDQANMSKLQLAGVIKKFIPDLEILENSFAEDPDKRNYIVSSQKLADIGFSAKYKLEDGITQLLQEIDSLVFYFNDNSNVRFDSTHTIKK